MVYAPTLTSLSQPTFSESSVNRLRHKHARAWQSYEEGLELLQKRPDRAKKHFNNAVKFAVKIRREDAARLANAIGGELIKIGRYKEALPFVQKALELEPNLLEAHNNLGILLKEQKRYKEAEEEYRKALGLPEAHNNLGILLGELKRYEDAKREYSEALGLKPDNPEAHNNLGVLLKGQKRYKEAEEKYREALRLKPNYPEARINLGNLLRELERYTEAEAECRKAAELAPNNPITHNNLGLVLYERKKYEEAESAYRKAIKLDSEYPEARINLGVLLGITGRYEEAEGEFEESVRLFKEKEPERLEEAVDYLDGVLKEYHDSYPLWRAKGKFLKALGRDAEAQECLETAEAFENLDIPDIEHDIVVRMRPIDTWKVMEVEAEYLGPAHPRVVVDLEEDELITDKD